jgi:hypothetical protein
MMFSSSTYRLVLLVSAACNAMTSAADVDLVILGTAGDYAILAKTGISTVPTSAITGNIAVSPIAATAMTGFSLILDPTTQFSKSTQVTGEAHAASYGGAVATTLTTAVSNMETAYTDAAGRTNPDAARINLGTGILGGVNPGGPDSPLTPGVYTFGTDVLLTDEVHFSGSATDVFIIQMTGNLLQVGNKKVILDGVKAENIFWQVAGFVNVGAGAHMEGIILAKTKVDFLTGSSLNGRVLTQTACNLQMATITQVPASRRRGLRSN